MTNAPLECVYRVDDGFGNVEECRHGLPARWCCLEIVRPGKTQCVCEAGLAELVRHHYIDGFSDGAHEAERHAE